MSGFIELETARGYNAASDNFFSSHITVKAKNGGYVSLEGANFEYKCKPVWKEDELTGISIDLIFFVNVSQQTTPENIYTKDYIAYLQTEAAKVLDAEMLDVIKLSQKANSDFLALNDRVRVANPVRWERVKNGWNALFPKLEITAKTRVVIRRPYDIRMPVGSEEGVRDE
ncbi:MAG: Ger(x)C family spore germination C-terminal domain-containing protein [Oscillospiraceae bacterium]|nr:Ger(x)C family spore germination C-terminal domain-containing protein [Oscillospiraceae bacterium]